MIARDREGAELVEGSLVEHVVETRAGLAVDGSGVVAFVDEDGAWVHWTRCEDGSRWASRPSTLVAADRRRAA